MNKDGFARDNKDRRIRFLRGLNFLLGADWVNLEDRNTLLREALQSGSCGGVLRLRNNLANVYDLEFTTEELAKLLASNMTSGEFTRKYVAEIYRTRGRVGLNTLVGSSMTNCGGVPAIDSAKMDRAHKYGLGASTFRWCDVAEGPCNCGSYHQ